MTGATFTPGRRRLTPEHYRATEIAARFDGLPAGITKKSQLLAGLKQASEAPGVSAQLKHAVDTLMGWSREQDGLGDSRPIVWPSNQRLQEAWSLAKRQVQNTLTAQIRPGARPDHGHRRARARMAAAALPPVASLLRR